MIRYVLSMIIAAVAPMPAGAAPADTSSLPAGRSIVIGQSYTLHSAILASDRRINVYLPPDYNMAGKAFTVLYLLDGGEQEDFLHIAGLAQITSAYGDGRELIVVGIEGVDRRHDLTAPSTIASDLKAAPTSGGAVAYRRFLTEELKPWIAARFKTDGKSAIIGESLAGLFVLDTVLTHPRAFDDYIAVSPSLWWNGGRTSHTAAASLRAAHFSGQRLWLGFEAPPPPADQAAKERALQRGVDAALRVVRPKGLDFTVARLNEGHGSIYHPAALQAFRTLFAIPASER